MTLDFLDSSNCALMVVDIQERLMRVIDRHAQVTKNAALLMKTANILNIPLIATTQYVEKIGSLLPEISAELGDVKPIDKLEFGCFNSQQVKKSISELPEHISTLIVVGVETHICAYQTVLGGLMAGYKVWVPADAVSSRSHENYQSGLARIREIGGTVVNTELIIYELLQKAGTKEFKTLLPFLK